MFKIQNPSPIIVLSSIWLGGAESQIVNSLGFKMSGRLCWWIYGITIADDTEFLYFLTTPFHIRVLEKWHPQNRAVQERLHFIKRTAHGWYSTVHYGFLTTLLIDCTNITSVKTSGHVYWWFPSFWASCLLMPLNMLAWFFRAYNLSLCVYCCLHVIPRIYIDLESQVCSVYTRNIDDSLEIRPAWS